MNINEKEYVQSVLNEKVEKHKEKRTQHEESRKILEIQREELKRKLESIDSKILSSTNNVEYHTGKMKAYEAISSMLDEK